MHKVLICLSEVAAKYVAKSRSSTSITAEPSSLSDQRVIEFVDTVEVLRLLPDVACLPSQAEVTPVQCCRQITRPFGKAEFASIIIDVGLEGHWIDEHVALAFQFVGPEIPRNIERLVKRGEVERHTGRVVHALDGFCIPIDETAVDFRHEATTIQEWVDRDPVTEDGTAFVFAVVAVIQNELRTRLDNGIRNLDVVVVDTNIQIKAFEPWLRERETCRERVGGFRAQSQRPAPECFDAWCRERVPDFLVDTNAEWVATLTDTVADGFRCTRIRSPFEHVFGNCAWVQ